MLSATSTSQSAAAKRRGGHEGSMMREGCESGNRRRQINQQEQTEDEGRSRNVASHSQVEPSNKYHEDPRPEGEVDDCFRQINSPGRISEWKRDWKYNSDRGDSIDWDQQTTGGEFGSRPGEQTGEYKVNQDRTAGSKNKLRTSNSRQDRQQGEDMGY